MLENRLNSGPSGPSLSSKSQLRVSNSAACRRNLEPNVLIAATECRTDAFAASNWRALATGAAVVCIVVVTAGGVAVETVGGAAVGSGGVAVGSGGAAVGSGGVAVGSGGAAVGSGGAAVGSGGAAVGGGGAGAAAGDSGMFSKGPSAPSYGEDRRAFFAWPEK
jgi:hypothetical protein